MPSPSVALKALTQLGLEPLALYTLYQFGLRTGHYRRVEAASRGRRGQFESLKPLLRLPAANAVVAVLGDKGKADLLNAADEIASGKIRLFGGETKPLKFAFETPLKHWTDYELGRAPIPYADAAISDVKFVWEPARFGWALTLGRAYHVTGEAKYADAFWQCFEEFSESNPAYLGPYWMSGQEVAIRLMSLLWAAQFFESAPPSSAERRALLVRSIAEHAIRIPPTMVYARSQNNNHLVTESAALFAAGVALDQPKWRAMGRLWLNHALQQQISSYGEYIQHSTNYHRLMLQSVLWVDGIRRQTGERWPSATLDALMRASHWLFSMIDPISGQAPNLGANDGALILPLSSTPYADFRPTVQAAARAFLRTGLPAGPWDELALWLDLPAKERTADSDAYMVENLRGRNAWGYLRASRFRSRLGHMDQLHFDLWWRGQNIAVDAGTYLYNGEPPWSNPFVSSQVHNTITVDGQDQMLRGGRFLTLDWFPAYSKSLLESDEKILGRMRASHRGYQRLGVRHERTATVFADEHWEIKDFLQFTKPGEHVFRLHWLLLDGDWKIETPESRIEIHVRPPGSGAFTLRIKPDGRLRFSDIQTRLVRAGELLYGKGTAQPCEGWISPTYGVKVPALSFAVEVGSSKSISLVSEFIFG